MTKACYPLLETQGFTSHLSLSASHRYHPIGTTLSARLPCVDVCFVCAVIERVGLYSVTSLHSIHSINICEILRACSASSGGPSGRYYPQLRVVECHVWCQFTMMTRYLGRPSVLQAAAHGPGTTPSLYHDVNLRRYSWYLSMWHRYYYATCRKTGFTAVDPLCYLAHGFIPAHPPSGTALFTLVWKFL